MTKYIFPFGVDFFALVIFSSEFIYMPSIGIPADKIGIISCSTGITYLVVCSLISRIITKKNCQNFLRFSLVMGMTVVWGFTTWSHHWWVHLILMGLWITALSFFFVSYPLTMSLQLQGESLYRFACLYTISWIFGVGLGAATGGIFLQYVRWLIVPFTFAGLLILLLCVGKIINNQQKEKRPVSLPVPPHQPHYVIIGLIALFVSHAVMSIIRNFYPVYALEQGFGKAMTGIALFWLNVGHIMFSLVLLASYRFVYRNVLVIPVILISILGLWTMLSPVYAVQSFGLMLVGMCAGYGTVLSVYYCLSDPINSNRNIAINEAVAGAGFSLNPLIAGFIMANFGFAQVLLYLAIILTVGCLLQLSIGAIFPRRLKEHVSIP